MRKLLSILMVAAVAALPASALAGGCSSGFRCTNACPLAKRASTRRATGAEATRVSVKVRENVARNLQRI